MISQRKTVLITGCRHGGIGGALAKEFHSQGLRVFATARSASQLVDLENLGIETFSLDVTSRAQIADVVADVAFRTGGTLDILVNNAGRSSNVAALDESDEELHTIFETNLFSIMYMVQGFANLLINAKGTIVNIGSIVAMVPLTFGSSYNATKAALHAYSDTLRIELKPFGVKVMVIITGGVKSNLVSQKRVLPQDSRYIPVATEYMKHQNVSQVGAMPNDVYAKGVVMQVLREEPPKWYWRGTHTWIVWILTTFCPRGVVHWAFRGSMVRLKELVTNSKTE